MKYSILGNTGLKVSAFCMGCLALGPAQYNLAIPEGQALINYAVSKGVNFFDASELYGVYRYLGCLRDEPGIVISSRSYAASREDMKASLDAARREMNRDKIEIFGLHEQESGLTLKGHRQALEYLAEAREKGLIGAVSVSTHYVGCVRSAALLPEVDVIFAILNIEGLGIVDGSRQDMEEALAFAHYMGKGIYIMKALGGGHLFRRSYDALSYARDFPYKHSVCVGAKNKAEIGFACGVLAYDMSREEAASLEAVIGAASKRLVVEPWCQGCGKCEEKCGFGAISVTGGKAEVNQAKCMLCGYCARVCPYFCLKLI